MSTPILAPIVPLLWVVFESILQISLLSFTGYLLAHKGVLDKPTQLQLNRLNVYLFTPCLLFSKIAFFLTPEKLKELSIIPLFFVIITFASAFVALILSYVFRLKRSHRAFAMAAAMFQNSNSLPIALMQSLVVTVPSLKWGEDDSKDAMLGRALTYLVVYSSLGLALRWSYGVQLLSHAEDNVIPDSDQERTPLLSSNSNGPVLSRHYTAPPTTRNGVLDSFPSSPIPSHTQLPSYTSYDSVRSASASPSETDSEMDDGRYLPSTPAPPDPLLSRLRTLLGTLSSFMTPPLYAALASLLVACVPPMQHFLEEHARPIKGAVNSAGACSIPVTLVVLGAYFHVPREQREEVRGRDGLESRRGRGAETALGRLPSRASSFLSLKTLREVFRRPRTSSPRNGAGDDRVDAGETKTVVISIVARMLITPLVLVPLLALCKMWDIQSVFDDPVFVVSNILVLSSPPALTLAQLTHAASGDAYERLISRTIFWAYCVATPPSTIVWVVVALLLMRL